MIEDEVNQFLANMILNIVVMILFSKFWTLYFCLGMMVISYYLFDE